MRCNSRKPFDLTAGRHVGFENDWNTESTLDVEVFDVQLIE